MPDTPPPNPELVEAERVVRESLAKISEHTDSVQIMVTKKLDDGSGHTWSMAVGKGNYYARYGHMREWVNQEEGNHHRADIEPEPED